MKKRKEKKELPGNVYEKDNPKTHWYPSEGWAIFNTGNSEVPMFEVQRIDELDILKSDDEALKLAKKKGYVFESKEFPFQVKTYITIIRTKQPRKL